MTPEDRLAEALKQLRLARRADAADERVDERLERAIADTEAARDRLAYCRDTEGVEAVGLRRNSRWDW